MANNEALPPVTSSFPPPPKYYSEYSNWPDGGRPPPEPIKGPYTSFGVQKGVGALPTLETENRVQLYPYGNIDPVVELKKLNHSLVASFLELLDTLDSNPSQYQEKIDDIELLFMNMHHLINTYRPHEARETLISYVESQIARRRECITGLLKQLSDSKEKLAQAVLQLQKPQTQELQNEQPQPMQQ